MSVNENDAIYPISVAAKLVGLSTHRLRAYDKAGLITPHRSEPKGNKIKDGRRFYSNNDIERLQDIKFLIDNGFSVLALKATLQEVDAKILVKNVKNQNITCK